MNQNASTESSASSGVAPDSISRRAYELWENEGRPEGSDLRHWLQAEQELAQPQSTAAAGAAPARNSDVTPLQGTRAAVAANATRDPKRSAPVTSGPAEKNGNGQNAPRRKQSAAPAL